MLESISSKNGKALLGIAFSFLLSNASLGAAGTRVRWTPEQDHLLEDGVRIYGASNWVAIAKRIPGKTAKQCRERWIYCLSSARGVLLRREAVTRHGNPGAVADEVDPANPQPVPAVVPARVPADGTPDAVADVGFPANLQLIPLHSYLLGADRGRNPAAVAGAADLQSARPFAVDIRTLLNHHH